MAVAALAAIAGLATGFAGSQLMSSKKSDSPATPIMSADQEVAGGAGTSKNAKKYLLSQNPSAGYGANSMNTAKSFLLSY